MMIPPQVTALSWLQLLGPNSIVLKMLGQPPSFGQPNPLQSAEGIGLLLGIQHAPLVFLTLRTQLLNLPREQIEAAQLSGSAHHLPIMQNGVIDGRCIGVCLFVGEFWHSGDVGHSCLLLSITHTDLSNHGIVQ